MQNNSPHINQNKVLKIITWNAAGIIPKLDELELFIQQNNIDIVLLSETHLIESDSIHINGFDIYSANHPSNNRRGGSALIINHIIEHIALPTIITQAIQITPVSISLINQPRTTIAAIYCPPQRGLTTEAFTLIFKLFEPRFLIAGDWNAQHTWWGNQRATPSGTQLINCIRNHNYNILATGSPTHFPYDQRKRPSAIDFAVYSGIRNNHLHIESLLDLGSDHLPLKISLSSKPIVISTKKSILPANADIKKFHFWLNQNIHLNTEISSGQDIEDAVDILTRNIHQAAIYANSTSSYLPLNSRFRLHHTPNRRIQNMLIAKRFFKYNHLVLRISDARRLHKITSKRLKKALKESKARRLERTLASIDHKDRYSMQKLWKFTKLIKRKPTPNLPVKRHTSPTNSQNNQNPNYTNNNQFCWCKTNLEKAEAFALHLEQRFTPFLLNTTNERLEIINQTTNQHPPITTNNPSFRPITLNDVKSQIKNLENNKSPGLDKIDNKTIKALPDSALLYLTLIFNNVLRHGHFPHQWKMAIVTMIPKPGKPTEELNSYRPISLLSGLSKILERLLLTRMFETQLFTRHIPDHQFGFRYHHSTDQQLARVTQFILKAYEKSHYCSAVFIDIQEAFDRVWHPGLFYKLKPILPPVLYTVVCHYLTNRHFMVECHEGARSNPKPIMAGVPQGSVLGPILYTIFTADLPTPESIPTNFPRNNMALIATYADDTVVMSSAESASTAIRQVETMLSALPDWSNKWCIKINVNKTGHVLYSLRDDLSQLYYSPKLMNEPIANKDSHTYLGVILDKKLNFCKHILNLQRKKLNDRTSKLDWLINKNSKLPLNCKTLLYKQLIAPVWQHALPVWGSLTSQTQFDKINTFQNTMLRKIINPPLHTTNETIHNVLKINTVEEIYNKTSTKLADRLSQHSNIEARKIIAAPYTPFRLARSRTRYVQQIKNHFIPHQQYMTPIPLSATTRQPLHNIFELQIKKINLQQRIDSLRSSLPFDTNTTDRIFTLRFPMSAGVMNEINHRIHSLNNELQQTERLITSLVSQTQL